MTETKKYKVIKDVADGKKKKERACVELGLTRRQVNRLVKAYKEKGKVVFQHGNRGKKPKHAMPVDIKEKIISKYESYGTQKPNITHFCELLLEEEGLNYSDTTIRRLLYQAGLLSPKTHRKTRKRLKKEWKAKKKLSKETEEVTPLLPSAEDFLEEPEAAHPSRPRKKFRGELIQMDASEYLWFNGKKTHLHLAIDDASGDIVGAYFDTQETLNGYYHVLEQILANEGIPFQFLTDKRTVFTYQSSQSKSVEEDTFTQFGFACHQLGIELETTSVPQTKGRVERLNQTLQSRLPIDLERHGIKTMKDANRFLKSWVKRFNKKFGNKTNLSVFEEAPKPAQRNLILARVTERKVDSGHHIRFKNSYYLPIRGAKDIYFTRKTKALVIEAFDGDIYLNIADTIYQTRKLEEHEVISQEFEHVQETKKERRKYIPPQSHPWKLASFKQYLRKIGKTYEEYTFEQDSPAQLQL